MAVKRSSAVGRANKPGTKGGNDNGTIKLTRQGTQIGGPKGGMTKRQVRTRAK